MYRKRLQSLLGEQGDSVIESVRRLFDEEEPVTEEEELVASHPFPRKRDWSVLTSHICNLIGERAGFRPHLDKLSSSCKEWMTASKNIAAPPMLLLPFNDKNDTCRFVELNEATKTYDLKMLELKDNWICGCSNGWLGLVNDNLDMVIFNPLTRAQIPLPRFAPDRTNKHKKAVKSFIKVLVPNYLRMSFVWKLVLSDDPLDVQSASARSCVVAVILHDCFTLAVCRLGDESWTIIQTEKAYPRGDQGFRDVVFNKGKMYANRHACLYEVDYHGPNDVSIKKIAIPYDLNCQTIDVTYMVMSCEDILRIERHADTTRVGNARRPTLTDRFVVFRLDRETDKWKVLHDLGGRTLFVGLSSSISVSAKEFRFRWCKPDCIYYLDHCFDKFSLENAGFQWDNGIINVKESNFVPGFDIQHSHSLSFWQAPAMWYLHA